MNRLLIIAAVLTAWTSSWAGVVTTIVQPENTGTVEASQAAAGETCTLTVTPAQGYYLAVEKLTAVTVISGGAVQAPERRTPDNIPVSNEQLEITPVNPDADPSGVTYYRFTMPEDGEVDVEVTAVFYPIDYGLTIAGIEVTGETIGDLPNGITFDPQNNTVTLSSINYEVEEGDVFLSTSLQALTIVLSGENTITMTTEDPIFLTETEEAVLTFAKPKEGDGKLVAVTTGELAQGFDQVVYNDNLVYQVVANGYVVSSEMVSYGIGIITNGQTTLITAKNRTNVLNDEGFSVSYDGEHTLTLTDARIEGISLDGFVGDKNGNLTIHLVGDNRITKAGLKAITNTTSNKLTFTTNPNEAGKLSYYDTSCTLTAVSDAFDGFADVKYNNNLKTDMKTNVEIDEETINLLTIYVPIPSVVSTSNPNPTVGNAGATITYDNENNEVNQQQLKNTVIDGFLYTTNDTQTPGVHDDGVEEGHEDAEGNKKDIMVLNSEMLLEMVKTLANSDTKPCTDQYAEMFKGVTFRIPRGSGKIYVRDLITALGYQLTVMIGNGEIGSGGLQKLYNFTTNNKYMDVEIPYEIDGDEFVRIFLTAIENPSAPEMGSNRIGPKAGVSGGFGGLSVSASNIEIDETTALSPALVEENTAGNSVVIQDLSVKSISDGAFSGVSKALAYIDLSGTSITGVTVSRSSGPFKDVDENTLIFMPAGNFTTETKNVVIGGVCDNLQMEGDGQHAFNVAKNFTAAKATLNRTFTEGKRSTVYLPFAVSQSAADALGSFYVYTGIEGTTVNMTKVTEGGLKANTPYIYIPEGSIGKVQIDNAEVKTAGLASYDFIGTYEKLVWPVDQDNIYCFAGDNTGGFEVGMFARMGAGSWVPPFRAYMRKVDVDSPVLDINWIDGEATGIETFDADSQCGNTAVTGAKGWHTVDGRRLSGKPAMSGLYIHNGKKVVIK